MPHQDFLTLMLVNMMAALLATAIFFWRGIDGPNPRHWAVAFAMPGLVALVGGMYLALGWPLAIPWANVVFGEPSVLLGSVMLGAAVSLAKGWDLRAVSVYAGLSGLTAVVIGVAIGTFGLTKVPPISMAGFICSGMGGVLAPFVIQWPRVKAVRIVAAAFLLAATALWALTAYGSYWNHLSTIAK